MDKNKSDKFMRSVRKMIDANGMIIANSELNFMGDINAMMGCLAFIITSALRVISSETDEEFLSETADIIFDRMIPLCLNKKVILRMVKGDCSEDPEQFARDTFKEISEELNERDKNLN